jgi:hypothetical protein
MRDLEAAYCISDNFSNMKCSIGVGIGKNNPKLFSAVKIICLFIRDVNLDLLGRQRIHKFFGFIQPVL